MWAYRGLAALWSFNAIFIQFGDAGVSTRVAYVVAALAWVFVWGLYEGQGEAP